MNKERVRTLRVSQVYARELAPVLSGSSLDVVELSPIQIDNPVEAQPEFVVVEIDPCSTFLHNGERFVPQERNEATRLFLCENVVSKSFRVLSENGSINTPVYEGLIVVQTAQFLQWRDAENVYLIKLDNVEDAAFFSSLLLRVGAIKGVKPKAVNAVPAEEAKMPEMPEMPENADFRVSDEPKEIEANEIENVTLIAPEAAVESPPIDEAAIPELKEAEIESLADSESLNVESKSIEVLALTDSPQSQEIAMLESKPTDDYTLEESATTNPDAIDVESPIIEVAEDENDSSSSEADESDLEEDEEEEISLEHVEALMSDIVLKNVHNSKATIRLSEMDALLEDLEGDTENEPTREPKDESEREDESGPEELGEQESSVEELPMENVDSILVDLIQKGNNDKDVNKFVSTLRQKAGNKATIRGTIRVSDLGALLSEMASNPLAAEFPESETDRLEQAQQEREAAEREAAEAEKKLQKSRERQFDNEIGGAKPSNEEDREVEKVVVIGGDDSELPKKKKDSMAHRKLQRRRSKSFVRDEELERVVTDLSASPTTVQSPPLPPKKKVVRKKVKKKRATNVPAKPGGASAPPPPPPPAKTKRIGGRKKVSPSEVMAAKKAINGALADWLGGSENTLRRVITASAMPDAPKTAEQLRSMVRMDLEIEPYSTLTKEQAIKNTASARSSMRDPYAVEMDSSSEESSEFVDIDGCGIRSLVDFEAMRAAAVVREEAMAAADNDDESIVDEEERKALDALKAFR